MSRISAGSRQLLVGPASTSLAEQMNVRSSTRATSRGPTARDRSSVAWRRTGDRTCLRPPATGRGGRTRRPSRRTRRLVGLGERRDLLTQASRRSLVVGAGTVVFIDDAAPRSRTCRRADRSGDASQGLLGPGKQKTPSGRRKRTAGCRACTLAPPRRGATRRCPRRAAPGFLRGTSTSRLNSATSTPSWLSTRVCTFTVPRSGFDSTPSSPAPRTRRTACRHGTPAPDA